MEIELASTKDLTAGQMTGVEKAGKSILIANVNGAYYAIGNICTHQSCQLSDGTLKGETVQCPCHDSIFNLKTGAAIKGPARSPEPSYQLKVEGEKIFTSI